MKVSETQPGDLLEVVTRLRRWMADRDTDGFLLAGSLTRYGKDAEAAAELARPLIKDAADAVYQLLLVLERTPAYKGLKHPPA